MQITDLSSELYALKDSEGFKLDYVQVVKEWLYDNDTHEEIYNLIWSDHRCINVDGQLRPKRSDLSLSTTIFTNNIGSIKMQTITENPICDPEKLSFYYFRMSKLPTPQWTTYDAVKINASLPYNVAPTLQERALISPIWFKPTKR